MAIPGLDLLAVIKTMGYAGIWGTVFLESGVLVFFFLPGDSLLFTAGFLASQHFLNIHILAAGCFVAAVLGNMLGYEIGKRVGLRLFAKGDRRFLKRAHLDMTQRFYARHGAMAVISARFMPVIRTFVPFLAGVAQMPYKRFFTYTVIGAFLWGVCLTVAGFFFGRVLPPEHVDTYLLPIIIAIIILSFLPSLWHLHRERKHAESEGREP
ncbi:MAG: VTT domain-containing protein [Alphaproteobacteria bacterium]|nr:VTT domain-containing protein [Alphaproteobacteria bacterium]MBU0859232.1 VTT domain-containing protein [Alphaproteobacteria bacterium]